MGSVKITNSQNLVLQGILSIGASSIIGAVSAMLQYLLRGGHVDIGLALSIFGAALVGIGGAALKSYVPSHAVQLIQAGEDTKAQLQQENAYLQQQLASQTEIKAALREIHTQQQFVPANVAQQVAQQFTTSLQQVAAQHLPLPQGQGVTVNVSPGSGLTASVQNEQATQHIVSEPAPTTVSNPIDGLEKTNPTLPIVPKAA